MKAPIVSKTVDRNTGEHVRNVVPKRSGLEPSGALPKVHLVPDLLAEEEDMRKTKEARKLLLLAKKTCEGCFNILKW